MTGPSPETVTSFALARLAITFLKVVRPPL